MIITSYIRDNSQLGDHHDEKEQQLAMLSNVIEPYDMYWNGDMELFILTTVKPRKELLALAFQQLISNSTFNLQECIGRSRLDCLFVLRFPPNTCHEVRRRFREFA